MSPTMPSEPEITLNVEGEVVRFTQMNTGEWWQMGSQSKYKSSFTARGAMLNLIWEQKQIIASLTTELEAARAETSVSLKRTDGGT